MRAPRFLRLTSCDDDDGDGFLTVKAHAEVNDYAGRSQAYFDTRELRAFAARLRQFPMTERVSIAGSPGRSDRVAIDCYPIGARGHLGVHVRLATSLWGDERPEAAPPPPVVCGDTTCRSDQWCVHPCIGDGCHYKPEAGSACPPGYSVDSVDPGCCVPPTPPPSCVDDPTNLGINPKQCGDGNLNYADFDAGDHQLLCGCLI